MSPCTSLLEAVVCATGCLDADLRLRGFDRRPGTAGHVRRAALLRPLPVHSERMTVPRGWEVVRLEPDPDALRPSSDDLEALANAVREAARPRCRGVGHGRGGPPWPPARAALGGHHRRRRRDAVGIRLATQRASRALRCCRQPPQAARGGVPAARVTGCPTSPRSSRPMTSAGSTPTSSMPSSPSGWEPPSPRSWEPSRPLAGPGAVVVGRDMRPSGPELVAAFCAGVTEQGVDVVDIGLASTDQLYFAAGRLDLPGAMFTASHNPAQYNGIKLCRAGATPVGQDSGLARSATWSPSRYRPVRRPARDDDPARPARATTRPSCASSSTSRRSGRCGSWSTRATGWPGTRPQPCWTSPGWTSSRCTSSSTGPSRTTRPTRSRPENLRDLQAAVLAEGADLGLAFDGDADRCFLVDERGELVSPSALTGLIAARELAKHPGAPIIHNLITSRGCCRR